MNGPLFHPITFKNLKIPGNIFLAPLAGFTDPAFREICIMHGASLTYSEMVSAEALARGSEKTIRLMKRATGEMLFAVQIFLPDSDTAKRALPELLKADPSVIDINCGCPVPKVVKTRCGSALMKNPGEIERIVRVLTEETEIPVTVKIRSGWDAGSINFLEAAAAAESGGAAGIAMHPRTRTQGYSGEADWSLLKELKEKSGIPVIGSGNLFTPEDVRRMIVETGVDGVMIARGAIGNPFIFEQTRKLLTEGTDPENPSLKKRFDTALLHLERCIADKGESAACKEMRKHMGSYTKGLPGGAALRKEIVHASTYGEYEEIINNYLSSAIT